jgi:hypothetical protein
MRGDILPLPNTPSWRDAQLKHRDNFTFTSYRIKTSLGRVTYSAAEIKYPHTTLLKFQFSLRYGFLMKDNICAHSPHKTVLPVRGHAVKFHAFLNFVLDGQQQE